MPFVTRCPYCRQGVRVPDHALAASLKCPKCQAWYTVVPETEPPRSPGSADSHPPPSPAPLSAPTTTPIPAAAPRPVITAPVTAEPAGAAETVPNLAVTLADIPAPDPDAEPESSEPDQPTGIEDPERWVEKEYQQQLVRRAVAIMRSDFEETTWRACWETVVMERPAAEVAAELGVSVEVVYQSRTRVLRRLRQELKDLMD